MCSAESRGVFCGVLLESYVTAPSDWESILDVGSGWTKLSTISDLLIQKQGYHHPSCSHSYSDHSLRPENGKGDFFQLRLTTHSEKEA